MNDIINKTISFGKVDYNNTGAKRNLVELEMELSIKNRQKPVFTVSAGVWNNIHSDILTGGQCIDTIWEEFSSKLENPSLYKTIMQLWEKWHLNDSNAGCKHQREQGITYEKNPNAFCKICNYKIGTSWKYRKIDDNDLRTILGILEVEPINQIYWLKLNKRIKSS